MIKEKICPYCKKKFKTNNPIKIFCVYNHGIRYNQLRKKRRELWILNEHDRNIYHEIRLKGEQNEI